MEKERGIRRRKRKLEVHQRGPQDHKTATFSRRTKTLTKQSKVNMRTKGQSAGTIIRRDTTGKAYLGPRRGEAERGEDVGDARSQPTTPKPVLVLDLSHLPMHAPLQSRDGVYRLRFRRQTGGGVVGLFLLLLLFVDWFRRRRRDFLLLLLLLSMRLDFENVNFFRFPSDDRHRGFAHEFHVV